jgi:hypothetical protein
MRGPEVSVNSVAVLINKTRGGGSAAYTLIGAGPGSEEVDHRVTNGGKTLVLKVKRSVIKNAVDNRRRYFWQANACLFPADQAPNGERWARQRLRHDHD